MDYSANTQTEEGINKNWWVPVPFRVVCLKVVIWPIWQKWRRFYASVNEESFLRNVAEAQWPSGRISNSAMIKVEWVRLSSFQWPKVGLGAAK